jgi:hypothetical protein
MLLPVRFVQLWKIALCVNEWPPQHESEQKSLQLTDIRNGSWMQFYASNQTPAKEATFMLEQQSIVGSRQ